MSKTEKILQLSCPSFLGGESRSIVIDSPITIGEIDGKVPLIRGIRFENAPHHLHQYSSAGGWNVAILGDEIDLLVNSYLHLEEIATQDNFEHYLTLGDARFIVEAIACQGAVKVMLELFVGQQRLEFIFETDSESYLNDWRLLIDELFRQIERQV